MNTQIAENLWPILTRAAWDGTITLLAVYLICRAFYKIPPFAKCWLWRLAWLRILASFAAFTVDLPLLPSAPPPMAAPAFVVTPIDQIRPAVPTDVFPAAPIAQKVSLPLFLAGVWIAVVALLVVRLLAQLWKLSRLRSSGKPAPQWEPLLARLCGQSGVTRVPALLIIDGISTPLLTGIFRPAIMLPANVASMDSARVELILRHELGHLKRRDLAWNCLAAAAQIALWFHPLMWLCAREAALAQEMACDEFALRHGNASAPEFANLLIDLAAARQKVNPPQLLTASIVQTKATLERRLKAMKLINRKHSKWAVAVIVLITALAVAPWRLVAQKTETGPAPATPPAGATEAEPSAEESLLDQEIKLAEQQLESKKRAHEAGRATFEDLAPLIREVLHLQRESAALRRDFARMRETLVQETQVVETLQKSAAKMQEVGRITPDEKFKVDRELLQLKRQIAAVDKQIPQPSQQSQGGLMSGNTNMMNMMYYMSNPELMKRYFPQMYAMMMKGTNVTTHSGLPVQIYPRRAGRVESVDVKPGQHVKQGHVLIRLDDREAMIQVKRAQSQLQIAETDFKLKKLNAQKAAEDIAGARNPNSDMRYAKDKADLELERGRAELDIVRQQVEEAQLAADHYVVRAPQAGVIHQVPRVGWPVVENSASLSYYPYVESAEAPKTPQPQP